MSPDTKRAVIVGGGLALDPTGWLAAASLAIGKAGLRSLAQTLHKELAPEGIHVATVTIAGQIQPGTTYDPDRIADRFCNSTPSRSASATRRACLKARLGLDRRRPAAKMRTDRSGGRHHAITPKGT